MDEKSINIYRRLYQHLQKVQSAGFKEEYILGIFLYGSQNYGTALDNSDVDSKCVVIPTMAELISGEKIPTRCLQIEDSGEFCTIMDVREYVRQLKKNNINFIETLFTEYFIVNKRYKKIWEEFLQYKDPVAKYNAKAQLSAAKAQCLEALKEVRRGRGNVTLKASYCKASYNAERLFHFLREYKDFLEGNASYLDCIHPNNKINYLLELRKGEKHIDYVNIVGMERTLCSEDTSKVDSLTASEKEKIDLVFQEFVKQCLVINFDFYKKF